MSLVEGGLAFMVKTIGWSCHSLPPAPGRCGGL